MSASWERERTRFAGQHSSIENVTIQPKFTWIQLQPYFSHIDSDITRRQSELTAEPSKSYRQPFGKRSEKFRSFRLTVEFTMCSTSNVSSGEIQCLNVECWFQDIFIFQPLTIPNLSRGVNIPGVSKYFQNSSLWRTPACYQQINAYSVERLKGRLHLDKLICLNHLIINQPVGRLIMTMAMILKMEKSTSEKADW